MWKNTRNLCYTGILTVKYMNIFCHRSSSSALELISASLNCLAWVCLYRSVESGQVINSDIYQLNMGFYKLIRFHIIYMVLTESLKKNPNYLFIQISTNIVRLT